MADGLDEVLAQCRTLLAEGACDPGSAWRTLTLGSAGPDGTPRLRSVVLRAFERESNSLEIHTDGRSSKVADYSARPAACLHGWDPACKVQLLASGPVSLHRADAIADAAWATLRAGSRATYRVMPGPGTVLAAPDDASPVLDDAGARAVFMVIRLRVAELEWLHLAEQGHRRAVFRWEQGARTAMWLAP